MAETIRGINVTIGSDTTGLAAALSDVNKHARNIQSELKQVERLLKLDPSNTELIAQKQKLLGDAVENTRKKLDSLKSVQQQVADQFARGEINEGQYRAFQREVAKTETELRQLESKLEDVTDEVKDQSKKVSKLGQDYQESFDQAKQAMGNSFEQMKKVGAGVTAFGAAVAGGLGIAVKGAADFEQGMANVHSVMAPEEVSEYRDELKDLAVTMGADTKYSATEAARGIEELVKAGVSIQDVLDGGLSGALSLATAGELELADAAEIASTALNAFKDDAISVQDAADILAGAANASATGVSELKFGLSQVAAVASGVGLSFKDTATALAVFAQNGLKGSDAGTSLKTMLLNLQPSTKAQIEEFDRLDLMSYDLQEGLKFLERNGIKPLSNSFDDVDAALKKYAATTAGAKVGSEKAQSEYTKLILQTGILTSKFYDAAGSIRSMDEIAGLLQDSMAGMTDAQRLASLEILFGTDAIRAGNILYKEGAQGINAMAEAMGKISAQDVAAQKMDTFKGALEELSGSVETAQIAIGSALIPALRALTGLVQKVVDAFNSMPQSVQTTIAVVGALVAALALLAGPLLLLIGFLPQIIAGFAALGPMLAALGPAFAALTGPIGLTIAAIAALVAGLAILYKKNDDFREFVDKTWAKIKDSIMIAVKAIREFVEPYVRDFIEFQRGQLEAWREFWDENGAAIMEGVKFVFNLIKMNIEGTMQVIKSLFQVVWPIIAGVVKVAWESMKLVIGNSIELIRGIIQTFIKILQGDWAGAWESVKDTVRKMWGNAEAFLRNVNLKQIGKDIIQGLIDGIGSMAGAVTKRVKEIAASIPDGVKDFLGIRSPSRVMMQMGEYTGEGFALGIGRTISDVQQRAREMAAAATNVLDGMSVPSTNGIGSNAASGNVSFEGMFSGANFIVRSDNDIKAIARELYDLQQTAMRGAGLA